MNKRIIVAIGLFLCLSFCCFAQESYISVSGGILGFVNAGVSPVSPVGSFEYVQKLPGSGRAAFFSKYEIYPYRKIQTRDGWGFSELAMLRIYASKSFFFEPGVFVSHYKTSQWSKTALYPTLGAGFNYKNRVIPEVVFKFRDPISNNHGVGLGVMCRVFTPLSKSEKWGIESDVGVWGLRFIQPPFGHLMGYDIYSSMGLYRNFR